MAEAEVQAVLERGGSDAELLKALEDAEFEARSLPTHPHRPPTPC